MSFNVAIAQIPACKWNPEYDPVCQPNATQGAALTTYIVLVLILSLFLIPLSQVIDKLVGVLAMPVRKKIGAKYVASVQPLPSSPKAAEEKTPKNALDGICNSALDADARIDIVVKTTMSSIRKRHSEIKACVEQGDESAKGALAAFERRYGMRRKHRFTWHALFMEHEDDDTRFERKLRRRITQDLKSADALDEEIKKCKHEVDKSRLLTEFARLDRLSALEQNVYLRNKYDDDKVVDDSRYVSKSGWRLAAGILFVLIVFPMYFTLMVFAELSSRSKATANGWLRGVCLFITFDTFFYQPFIILFFYVYLPSLIRVKLRALGDPTDCDIDFQFETPLIEGASSYCAVRHKELAIAPVILHRHATKSAAREGDGSRDMSSVARASVSLWLWGAILILPEAFQNVVVSEIIVFAVNSVMFLVVSIAPFFVGAWHAVFHSLAFENIYATLAIVGIVLIVVGTSLLLCFRRRRQLASANIWTVNVPDWVSRFVATGNDSTAKDGKVEIEAALSDTHHQSMWAPHEEKQQDPTEEATETITRNNTSDIRGVRENAIEESVEASSVPLDDSQRNKESQAATGSIKRSESGDPLDPKDMIPKSTPTVLPSLPLEPSISMRSLQKKVLKDDANVDVPDSTIASQSSHRGVKPVYGNVPEMPAFMHRPPPLPDIPKGKNENGLSSQLKASSRPPNLRIDDDPIQEPNDEQVEFTPRDSPSSHDSFNAPVPAPSEL